MHIDELRELFTRTRHAFFHYEATALRVQVQREPSALIHLELAHLLAKNNSLTTLDLLIQNHKTTMFTLCQDLVTAHVVLANHGIFRDMLETVGSAKISVCSYDTPRGQQTAPLFNGEFIYIPGTTEIFTR